MRKLLGKNENQYKKVGRLADVLALIQVLALDEYPHRSEDGLLEELQGKPQSAVSWQEIGREHPEFFRVREDNKCPVSLVARHVIPKDEMGNRELPYEFAGKLIQAAIELHDRQVRRAERWKYLIPVLTTIVSGFFAIIVAFSNGS